MFDRTLSSSWNDRSRRGLATLTSLGMQALAVAVLLVLPSLRPQGLPSFHQLSTPVSLGLPSSEPVPVRTQHGPECCRHFVAPPDKNSKGYSAE